jgi:hypothetical protein
MQAKKIFFSWFKPAAAGRPGRGPFSNAGKAAPAGCMAKYAQTGNFAKGGKPKNLALQPEAAAFRAFLFPHPEYDITAGQSGRLWGQVLRWSLARLCWQRDVYGQTGRLQGKSCLSIRCYDPLSF